MLPPLAGQILPVRYNRAIVVIRIVQARRPKIGSDAHIVEVVVQWKIKEIVGNLKVNASPSRASELSLNTSEAMREQFRVISWHDVLIIVVRIVIIAA